LVGNPSAAGILWQRSGCTGSAPFASSPQAHSISPSRGRFARAVAVVAELGLTAMGERTQSNGAATAGTQSGALVESSKVVVAPSSAALAAKSRL